MGLKKGSSGEVVTRWQQTMVRRFGSYAREADGSPLRIDGYFGNSDVAVQKEYQRRTHQAETGEVSDADLIALGLVARPSPPQPGRRKIWFYSAPGSGAAWWVGPSFETGQWCKDVLHINHQPIGFPMGGYMGLMGGDPGLSYNEVIAAEGAELERLLDTNPDINDPEVEFWFSGYSQSADGMEDALVRLFGDGGKYRRLRSRINGTLMFGNPSRQPGPTKVGNNPPGWGISRKLRPQWLRDLTWSITTTSPGAPDFYACCDDEIRPVFYAQVVQAETSLSFAQHIAAIAIPVISNLFGDLGKVFGQAALASTTKLPSELLAAVPTEDVDRKIIDLLSVKGVLTNIPTLLHLLASVSGIQTHGEYHLPKPEFGGRTGIQVACDAVASFRR